MESVGLSRISKLFVDRDQTSPAEVLARREQFDVTLACGADVQDSYTLQLAVLTAASIAVRCFPRTVWIALPRSLRTSRFLVWPAFEWTFEQALVDIMGPGAFLDSVPDEPAGPVLVFGDALVGRNSLRVTFDGWIAKVGPASEVLRLAEREYCSVAGILGAALAMSELFFSFAQINVEAGRRVLALSLWRPDLDADDPTALGVPVEYLPKELWILGLGHLGNAYLWSLATLPYADPREVEFALMDFDKVESENAETGLVFHARDAGRYKTHVCSEWLELRGFGTKLVDRRFDATFRNHPKEARLALCGFDSNLSRRHLGTADFSRVVESGLGGTVNNFDTISLHTLPHPRPVTELWPDPPNEEQAKQRRHQEQVARTNKAYAHVHHDECGRYELAGKAIAVPFVGATAGALVVAEVLRLAHGGASFTDMKIRLGAIGQRSSRGRGNYGVSDLTGLTFCRARTGHSAGHE